MDLNPKFSTSTLKDAPKRKKHDLAYWGRCPCWQRSRLGPGIAFKVERVRWKLCYSDSLASHRPPPHPCHALAPGSAVAVVSWPHVPGCRGPALAVMGSLQREGSRSYWASVPPDLNYWSSSFGTAFFWNIFWGGGLTEHLSYFRHSLANIFREGKIWRIITVE